MSELELKYSLCWGYPNAGVNPQFLLCHVAVCSSLGCLIYMFDKRLQQQETVYVAMWQAMWLCSCSKCILLAASSHVTNVSPATRCAPQMDLLAFYHGLRMRNWTSDAYSPSASPWRLQFFQCGYVGVSGWPGWRAVVTEGGGSRSWVDMPNSGPESFLRDYAAAGEWQAC